MVQCHDVLTSFIERKFLQREANKVILIFLISVFVPHRASFGEVSRRIWCTLVTGRRTASSTKSPGIAASTVGYRSAWKLGCLRSVSIKLISATMPRYLRASTSK